MFLEYSIDASHFLPNVPDGHKCGRMHGHRYDIRIELSGVPDPKTGWIMDYADIKDICDPIIIGTLDHRCLNNIPELPNPTCEALVEWLRDNLIAANLNASAIEIRETNRAGAGWRR